MAGKIIADTIQTEASFLQLNVSNTRIATMNASGIYSNTGGKIIGSDGTFGNSTIVNATISSNLNFDTTGTSGIRLPAANTLAFHTGGTEDMRIDSSGNVGIGTTSTTQKLVLNGNMLVTGNAYAIGLSNNFYAGIVGDNTGNNLYYKAYESHIWKTQTDAGANATGTERMRLDSSGSVQIGGTASPSGTQRIVTHANGANGVEHMLFNELRTSSATENYVRFYRNGSQVGSISNTLSATAYNTSSDYRLKQNIAPMTGALSKVAQLKPVTYKWKVDGSNGQGFIAHELQSVVPDCVYGEKDAVDADGNPKYQGVDTSFLVATLTAAIQEQQAIIADLKARIEVLEA
jgi:hypothetical protein